MFLDSIKNNCFSFYDRPAYISGRETLTYGALWDKASRLATYLQRNGDSPVLVYGHKDPYMLISFIACLISGRTYVPCDTSFPVERVKYCFEKSGAGIVLAVDDFPTAGLPQLSKEEITDICVRECETDILSEHTNAAYIIFTSGSTGKPKGVPISCRNLENFIQWVTNIPEITQIKNTVILNQASFSFDMSVADIFISLVQGNTLFALTREEQKDFSLLFSRMEESRCRMMICTPSFMQLCLCDGTFDNKLLPVLDTVFFCGEVLHVGVVRSLYKRFPGIKIINAYGPTEATCAVCAVTITPDMLSAVSLPIGKVETAAVEITITNADAHGVGEITLSGKSVFGGYIGEQKLNENYLTGDYGTIKDGLLYFHGRKDNQIKYKGYRIEPEETEAVLRTIPGVKNAFVIPIYNKNKKVLSFTAVIETGVALDDNDIIAELKKQLPEYMIPKNYVFTEHLPLNSNLKSSRKHAEEVVKYGRQDKENSGGGMQQREGS
jgi:D-alanine--poly(phosphoribitol) ligase subunit 1